tara:strand:- start:934 stop:1233 length:300 start_codon:yes stop_codon:yes gene_type:complete
MHSVIYQGLLRFNRVVALNLLIPNHPLAVTASSEIISILGPYINPKTRLQALNIAFAILYTPEFSSYFLDIYTKKYLVDLQIEICLLLLFISYNGINLM